MLNFKGGHIFYEYERAEMRGKLGGYSHYLLLEVGKLL